MALRWNLIFEGVSTLVLLGGGIYAFGRFSDRMDQFERRLDSLEAKAMPGTHLGDLCLKLLDDERTADINHDSGMSDRVAKQLDKFGCYARVNVNATTNETQPENAISKEP